MQLAHTIWIINVLPPLIHIFQARADNTVSIFTGRSIKIQACNRSSLCHRVPLLPVNMHQSLASTRPHQTFPQRTPPTPVDAVDDNHSDEQSTTACLPAPRSVDAQAP